MLYVYLVTRLICSHQNTLDLFTHSNRLDLVAQLAEHWTSKPKVAGSIPTVVRQIFQLARCGYTAISIKVVPEQCEKVEYEREKVEYEREKIAGSDD